MALKDELAKKEFFFDGKKYKNSEELCELVSDKYNGKALLRFSCGKDAIGSWLQMRKYFTEIIPVYHYGVPGLGFVERSLKYYEDFFGHKIFRVPNRHLFSQLNAGLYQTKESWEHVQKCNLAEFDNDDINDYIKEDLGLNINILTGLGVRAFDGLNRQRSIKKHGGVNENRKTFLPVYDWDIERLVSEIKKSGVKLPVDYKIWGKSFDGFDYRFIKPLRDNFPEDYEKIKELFPLIDVEIKRFENFK